jgi:hypothetical protein
MQITLETKPFAALETEALVSYVFEEIDPVQGRIAEIDQAAAGLLRKLAKSGELTGKNARVHACPRACRNQGSPPAPRRSREARAME